MVGNVLIVLVAIFAIAGVLLSEKSFTFKKEKELFKANIAYKMSCLSLYFGVLCLILYAGFGEGV